MGLDAIEELFALKTILYHIYSVASEYSQFPFCVECQRSSHQNCVLSWETTWTTAVGSAHPMDPDPDQHAPAATRSAHFISSHFISCGTAYSTINCSVPHLPSSGNVDTAMGGRVGPEGMIKVKAQ